MKVLVVSYLLDPQRGGGAATAALRLCQGLTERGIEVVTVTTPDEPQPRTVTQDGIRSHAFRPVSYTHLDVYKRQKRSSSM